MTTPASDPETGQRRREKSDRYFLLSQRLLKHAQEQLDQVYTVQASEKAYGAVSHAVKSYGELRGWNHFNHHRVGLILDQLRDEENDPTLTESYDAVESLHKNFLEYEMDPTRVKDRVDAARNLVDKLERLRTAESHPLPSSSLNREQRRRLSLLMQPPAEGQAPSEDLPPLEDLPQ